MSKEGHIEGVNQLNKLNCHLRGLTSAVSDSANTKDTLWFKVAFSFIQNNTHNFYRHTVADLAVWLIDSLFL